MRVELVSEARATPGAILGRRARVAAAWAAGFALALLIAWGASALWLPPYLPYVWEPTLDRYVVAPGTYRSWEEGDGVTCVGRFGVAAIPDIMDISTDAVLIWGDSYVEAMQVNDADKTPQVVTREWNAAHPDRPLTAVGLAMRGWGLADIYFQMPRYRRLVPRARAHFVVLAEIEDLDPGRETRESRFVADPSSPDGFRFVESHWSPRAEGFKQFLMRCRLQVVWQMLKRVGEMEVRFAPGRGASPAPTRPEESRRPQLDAWRFALGRLREQAGGDLTLVYLPRLPVPVADGAILADDPDAEKAAALRRLCDEMGLPLIDLTAEFAAMPRAGLGFPHGFPNTFPWQGHLNAGGHRCVARAILRHLEARPR
jgi:hypothetical protein